MIFVNFSRTPPNLYLQRQKKLLWRRNKGIRETNLRRCLLRLRLPFPHLRLLIQHRRTPPIRVRARAPTRADHRLHPTAILDVRPKLSLRRKAQVIDDLPVYHHKGEETIELAVDLHKEKANTSVIVLPLDHLVALLALHHEGMDEKRTIAR